MPKAEFAGHAYNDTLKGPEYKTHLLPAGRFICVVGTGSSDIGKGWTTAAIASHLENPLMVKYDPMLNAGFPHDVGVDIGGRRVTDDFQTYVTMGLKVHPQDNIMAGGLMSDYFAAFVNPPEIAPGKTKKQTFADVSEFLAVKLAERLEESGARNACMEIGGIIGDMEQSFLPGALRRVGALTGVMPEVVLLTQFENADIHGSHRLKTQGVRAGIREAMARYAGLPLSAVLVRANKLPEGYPEDVLLDEFQRIAYETETDPDRFALIHNHPDVHSLAAEVGQLKLVEKPAPQVMVSACLVGAPCRFKGNDKMHPQALNIVAGNGQAMIMCPEVMGGLSTPRPRSKIEAGFNGIDVLEGRARVITEDGRDVTDAFIKGAIRTLEGCRQMRVKTAYLKSESPSCGTESPTGVTAALLQRWGIEVVSSDTL